MNMQRTQGTSGAIRARVDNAALFAVLSSLADNKQAIGRRYAYWCNGAPALEAAVAASFKTMHIRAAFLHERALTWQHLCRIL